MNGNGIVLVEINLLPSSVKIVKKLEKIERVELPPEEQAISFEFAKPLALLTAARRFQ